MIKIIAVSLIGICLVSCKTPTTHAASAPEIAAKPVPSGLSIKPETKVKLLVYQAKLVGLEKAIDESPLGAQRREVLPKFQAILQQARADCKGAEPTFSDDDVICPAPAPKK